MQMTTHLSTKHRTLSQNPFEYIVPNDTVVIERRVLDTSIHYLLNWITRTTILLEYRVHCTHRSSLKEQKNQNSLQDHEE